MNWNFILDFLIMSVFITILFTPIFIFSYIASDDFDNVLDEYNGCLRFNSDKDSCNFIVGNKYGYDVLNDALYNTGEASGFNCVTFQMVLMIYGFWIICALIIAIDRFFRSIY